MLRLAGSLIKKSPDMANITALHVTPGTELNQFNAEEYERESFHPIQEEAKRLHLRVATLFKPSQDIDKEIIDTANFGKFDLLLVGIGKSVFEGTLLGKILGFTTKIINPERIYDAITGKEKLFEDAAFDDRTRQIIRTAKVPLGILIDKSLVKIDNVFVPVFSPADSFLFDYAQKLTGNERTKVTFLDASGLVRQNPLWRENILALRQAAPRLVGFYHRNKIEKDFLERQDLMLISLESWRKAVETQSVWLSYTPSVLILKA
jgi:hypothetical protein